MIQPLPLFVDAVYLIASFDPNDQWRDFALELVDLVESRSLVTTDGVLSEFLAHCSRFEQDRRHGAARYVQELRASGQIEIVELTSALVIARIEAYAGEFRYSRLSLQDCISILVMRQRGIWDALTADREFTLAGINVLMHAPAERG